eukprot:TRINITY_DN8647_c1_g1_i3.p1 TRINITY_DN8647_c1_g1~~TRINITY_DN8647_c1_g1_i3.p1  ORF type:complete len:511 (+),score=75.24 TRINITY_DN8647_c1_g1_i3:54-1535(+)
MGPVRKLLMVVVLFFKFFYVLSAELLAYCFPSAERKAHRNPYLVGNFAPVHDELTAESLPVHGRLPDDLQGEFVRNGPNPRWDNNPKHNVDYHWFDGDGMLHGVLMQNGKASYVNRYVKTDRFKTSEAAHGKIDQRIGETATFFGFIRTCRAILSDIVTLKSGRRRGTANTALEYHDGKLFALVENDFPHQIQAPLLDTVGAYDYDGALKHNFTAHPKVDYRTGEMVFFGYNLTKKPFVHYAVVSAQGKLLRSVPIDLEVPVMMHDMGATENYSIILELPFTFRPERVLNRESVFGFEEKRPSRYGFIPRHGTNQNQIKWLQGPSCYLFHVLNCYEKDKDNVVMYACRSERSTSYGLLTGNTEILNDKPTLSYLYRWDFDLAAETVKETQISSFACEFPRINDLMTGYYSRYGYVMRLRPLNSPEFDALVKYDFGDGEEGAVKSETFEFGADEAVGEMIFVPRQGATLEDDGYLMTFVYNNKRRILWCWTRGI